MDDSEALRDYLVHFREVEDRARATARRWTLLPLGVGAVWMALSFWQAKRAHEAVTQSQSELVKLGEAKAKLTQEIAEQRRQLADKQERIDAAKLAVEPTVRAASSSDAPEEKPSVQDLEARIDKFVRASTKANAVLDQAPRDVAPLSVKEIGQAVKVSLERTPTDKMAGKHKLYGLRFSLQGPDEVLKRIDSVRYHFDHPTFANKTKVGTVPGKGFEIRYLGWGCLDEVTVTLVLKGTGEDVPLPPFPFCDKW